MVNINSSCDSHLVISRQFALIQISEGIIPLIAPTYDHLQRSEALTDCSQQIACSNDYVKPMMIKKGMACRICGRQSSVESGTNEVHDQPMEMTSQPNTF